MYIKAKKSLGQNFLIDREVLEKIVSIVKIADKEILEIGPGSGNLTSYILKKNPKKVFVIEKDDELSLILKDKFANQIEIINDDVLKISENEITDQKLVVFGNLPYNISTEILSKWIININKKFWFESLLLMFQKEVAERIACKKGKKRRILYVFLQAFYDIEYCFTVDEHVFNPPPKVKSGVIKLVRNSRKELPVDEKKFKRVVKAGYNQRRKTLKNAMKPFEIINENEIADLLALRAEQLSVDDFIKLTNHVR